VGCGFGAWELEVIREVVDLEICSWKMGIVEVKSAVNTALGEEMLIDLSQN
jgi:hypothetical protein